MAENATATPAAAPQATPAADPTPAAPRTPDSIFDAAKARMFKAMNDELKPLTPPVAPHPSEQNGARTGQPPAPAPTINVDPEALSQITKLSKQLREANAKLKELEPSAAPAKALADAKALYASGKKLEAIAALSGAADPSAEMEALLADYLKGGDGGELTAADLKKQWDAEKAAQAAEKDKAAKEAAEKAAAAEADGQRQAALGYLDHVLAETASKYEIAAKTENRKDATAAALAAVETLRAARGIDPEKMTPEEGRALVEEAFEEVEVEYMLQAERDVMRERLRERVRKGALQTQGGGADSGAGRRGNPADLARREQPETRQPAPATIDRNLSRPGISTQPQRRNLSHEAAKAKAIDAQRQRGAAR